MGTWHVGPFDNDVAMDFFDEIEETPDEQVLKKLSEVLAAVAERPGRVELDEGHLAVAAAGLVAAGRSRSAATGGRAAAARPARGALGLRPGLGAPPMFRGAA